MNYPVYGLPSLASPVDQGDIIDGCPILVTEAFDLNDLSSQDIAAPLTRVLVLTQTCDLANGKVTNALGAVALEARAMAETKVLKEADIRGPIRAGRVYGWYFLPKCDELGLAEMVVDLRQLHTVRLDMLTSLCQRGQRRARVQPLYREHLAKHFADTYSRIGLPEPYATE